MQVIETKKAVLTADDVAKAVMYYLRRELGVETSTVTFMYESRNVGNGRLEDNLVELSGAKAQ